MTKKLIIKGNVLERSSNSYKIECKVGGNGTSNSFLVSVVTSGTRG